MDTMHWWLIKIAAIQTLCVIGVGYGICVLAKKHLVPAKVKVPAQTLVRVRRSPLTGISYR